MDILNDQRPITALTGARGQALARVAARRSLSLTDCTCAEEANEDPLVFLLCNHAFPASYLDGYLELHTAYARDGPEGRWREPAPLQARRGVEGQC